MIGGLFKSTSRLALVAAAGLFAGSVATPATAADLGGDCCADLEERVAELEATTVRKGNRKVSLKLSGQVNKALLYWDDGDLTGAYVVDNIQSSTRLRLSGSAKISADYSAGFYIEFELDTAASSAVDQFNGRHLGTGSTVGGALQMRQAYWYLKSKSLGKFSLGRLNSAAKNITLIGLGSQSEAAYNQMLWGGGMHLRTPGTTGHQSLLTGTVGGFFFGTSLSRREGVRYDSPTFAGFTLSASWADDDVWDVALRYAGEFGGIRVAAAIGYEQDNWENPGLSGAIGPPFAEPGERDDKILVANVSLLHVSSGLFVTGAYYQRDRDGTHDQVTAVDGTVIQPDGYQWSIHAGIYQKFFALGKTTIYGEYIEAEDGREGTAGAALGLPGTTIIGSTAEVWGVGIVQNIDAAAMNLYLAYRNISFDATGVNAAGVVTAGQYEDLDMILAGARINF